MLLLHATPLLLRNDQTRDQEVSRAGRASLVEAGVLREDCRLTITRQSAEDVGFREIFVSVDSAPLGILRYGDTVTTEIAAGPHDIRAHNTLFWKTHRLVLRPGEHARFTAINRAGWGTFGMLFVLGAMPVYLTFERMSVPEPSRHT